MGVLVRLEREFFLEGEGVLSLLRDVGRDFCVWRRFPALDPALVMVVTASLIKVGDAGRFRLWALERNVDGADGSPGLT